MNEIQNKEKALNPTVVKLGLVSFFADVASEMLYPITPILLTSILGASMTSLGTIEGIAESIASLMKTYSGYWSDKLMKRKPFIIIGYLLAAISKPLIGLSQSWVQVLAARSADRFGKGLRSAPRDAMISESVEKKYQGLAFGWHRAMDTLGATLGPLITIGFLNSNPNEIRNLYYWALIPGTLSIFILLLIKEKRTIKTPQPFIAKFDFKIRISGSLKQYLFAWGIFSLCNSSDVFLILKAKSSGISLTNIILMYCGYNFIYSFSSPIFGKWSDNIDRKKILSLGLIIFALVYFGFSQASQVWQYCLLFVIYGCYMGATDGVSKALAVDLSDSHQKATTLGILGTISGFGTLFASLFAGLLWDHAGSQWTFLYGAGGALIAVFLLLLTRTNSLR